MATEIIYQLNDPTFTIYHRAALGGLASTLMEWDTKRKDIKPNDIEYEYDNLTVKLRWDEGLDDTEAIARILEASFRLTDERLIDLPGHGLRPNQDEQRVAIHNAILGTFLQHNKMRPAEKKLRHVNLSDDDEKPKMVSYKALLTYAHRTAQGTDLLKKNGDMPTWAKIPQSLIPGVTAGAKDFQVLGKDALLLLFLMVGCPVYILRSKIHQEKAQYGIVVPNVINLEDYCDAIRDLASSKNKYVGEYERRIVGGLEEAALQFMLDIRVTDDLDYLSKGVDGCLTICMGRVAWDKNQINRSAVQRIRSHYEQLGIFIAAKDSLLGEIKTLITDQGEAYSIPASVIPSLTASNLVTGSHWARGFAHVVKEQKEFKQLLYMKEGFVKMNSAINLEEERALIDAFHEAWERTMAQLGDRARRDGLDFKRLVEVEQERIRNTILRQQTVDSLANWFLQFCASATRGGAMKSFQKYKEILYYYMCNQKYYERFQNLCLFALLSYSKENGGK
ncbi:MAG TPA: type I-MYXAN CRISPR-associated Cas8a1/Cmx1 [Bacillota bacterium]|nr:type I-MYXAN CRISPR-associated Cas8a1/Cmx1 [Bacillota bacterium]